MKALEILYETQKLICSQTNIEAEFVNEAITELELLKNRSCMNCKHNEITICKKLPSIDWSFEPTNDFDCRKWELK